MKIAQPHNADRSTFTSTRVALYPYLPYEMLSAASRPACTHLR